MLLTSFPRAYPKAIVVSHERSGTHFLMNALAKCFGYVSAPWVNLDNDLGINFHSSTNLAAFFAQFRGHHIANIVKSHHSFDFFEPILDGLLDEFRVFYVCRDPRDVMVSYWKFLNALAWNEGPKVATISEFLRSEPSGQMLRYQMRQEKSVLHRWRRHVDGWTLGAAGRVTFVHFDDLSLRYEKTMLELAKVIGTPPQSLDRPSLTENTVLPGLGLVGQYVEHFSDSDHEWVESIVGPTMDRIRVKADDRTRELSAVS